MYIVYGTIKEMYLVIRGVSIIDYFVGRTDVGHKFDKTLYDFTNLSFVATRFSSSHIKCNEGQEKQC